MPKQIAIASHLSTEELFVGYRQAIEPSQGSHYQIIWLLKTGKTIQEVSQVTEYSKIWIYQLVKRYNKNGVGGLSNKRYENLGKASLLSDI